MLVKTVLLIEDEELVSATVRMVLTRADYEVLSARSFAEAKELWASARDRIHLVISDNSLPDGSGIALVQQLEREKPSLAILIASGLDHPGLPAHYYQIRKPFSAAFLLAFVKGALERQGQE